MSYIDNNGKFNHGKWMRDRTLNESPNIQRSKVDYSTMDLKSNINLKWRSYDDMFHDLEQWIQVSTDGMGPAQVRVMARELKELSMKYMGYKPDDFDNPDFSDFAKGDVGKPPGAADKFQ